jgi:RHS repeat-associated protein
MNVEPQYDYQKRLFTRREFLKEANLYDYRNRVYSAELGRFLQTDPIRFDAGDGNLYRYVGNNSALLVDPSGTTPAHFWGGVIAAFAALTADIIQEFGEWIANKAYTRNVKRVVLHCAMQEVL